MQRWRVFWKDDGDLPKVSGQHILTQLLFSKNYMVNELGNDIRLAMDANDDNSDAFYSEGKANKAFLYRKNE